MNQHDRLILAAGISLGLLIATLIAGTWAGVAGALVAVAASLHGLTLERERQHGHDDSDRRQHTGGRRVPQ